jgi:hypothetical protein
MQQLTRSVLSLITEPILELQCAVLLLLMAYLTVPTRLSHCGWSIMDHLQAVKLDQRSHEFYSSWRANPPRTRYSLAHCAQPAGSFPARDQEATCNDCSFYYEVNLVLWTLLIFSSRPRMFEQCLGCNLLQDHRWLTRFVSCWRLILADDIRLRNVFNTFLHFITRSTLIQSISHAVIISKQAR